MNHISYSLYDEIAEVKVALESVQMQISGIREQKISQQRVLEFLELFDIMYEEFTEAEKKEFFNSFIKRIDIYPQPLENGQILKSIQFRFPVYYQGNEVDMFFSNEENTVETVCLLSKLQNRQHIEIELDMDELDMDELDLTDADK